MEPTDLTIEILRGIRDEVRGVREEVSSVRGEVSSVRDEVRGVREEVVQTNVRLDRLEHRQNEAEIRVATRLVELVGTLNEVRDTIRTEAMRRQVDDLERRMRIVEART